MNRTYIRAPTVPAPPGTVVRRALSVVVADTGVVPELPEVESARATISGRRWTGRSPTSTTATRGSADRTPRATSGPHWSLARSPRPSAGQVAVVRDVWDRQGAGPVLGLHLGMSGRILVSDGAGGLAEGGDRIKGSVSGGAAEQADRRPTGRVSRSPSTTAARCACSTSAGSAATPRPRPRHLGPDAARISAAAFRERVGRGTAPVKARLLDQSVLGGVGQPAGRRDALAARMDPRRPMCWGTTSSRGCAARCGRPPGRPSATAGCTPASYLHSAPGGHCPRCGAAMERATVGGRTTWFCPREQI